MMLVMLVEMGCHVRTSTETVSTSDYVSYPEKYEETEALLQQLEKRGRWILSDRNHQLVYIE